MQSGIHTTKTIYQLRALLGKSLIHLLSACAIKLFSTTAFSEVHIVADRVTLNSPVVSASLSYTRINFQQSFLATPLVFVLPSNSNPDPATIRVIKVTTSYFDVAISEAPGEDNNLPATGFDFFAIEPGSYTLGSMVIEAGLASTTAVQDKLGTSSWSTQPLSAGFAAAPAVLLELQSVNHDNFDGSAIANPWLETVSRNQTTAQFQFALDRAETSAGAGQVAVTVPEQVAWLAISNSGNESFLDNDGSTIQFQSFRSGNNVRNSCLGVNFPAAFSGVPKVVASQSSRNGADGGWVLSCGNSPTQAQVKIQEDQTNDTDVNHTTEIVSILASSDSFTAGRGSSDTGFRMEMGSGLVTSVTSSTLNFTSVLFPETLTATPIVFSLPTLEGANPASLRFRNITASGFEVAQVEPDGSPGAHESMNIDYLAAIPGSHALPDGTIIEVGSLNTNAFQSKAFAGDSYSTINFANTFVSPSVLFDIQTINNEPSLDPSLSSVPFLETTSNSITATTATVALDRGKSNAGFATLLSEEIGYLAIESNLDANFKDVDNNVIQLKSLTTGAVIQGVDDGACYSSLFSGVSFAATPIVVANKVSHNGGDGGWLRRCNVSSASVQLVIDEDQSDGTNRSHGASEQASLVAFSSAFAWGPVLVEMDAPTIAVEQDPINGATNAKSLPDSWLRYTQRIRNRGRIEVDSNSVSFDLEVPLDSDFFVGDLLASGPIAFRDIFSSGVTLPFIDLSSTADGIEFSNDGGLTYNYIPTADPDGFDSDVTHIRLAFSGALNATGPVTTPREFEIGYRVRVR